MLEECSNQNTKSGAVEDAARYYCRMRGGGGYNSAIEQLLTKADRQGFVTPQEIAEILDARELPVEYDTEITIGEIDE